MSGESGIVIESPKRPGRDEASAQGYYPYYAGFSYQFAHSVISSSGLQADGRVLDPWNGSGTTTAAAASLGYDADGIDLNPVMALVAKARLLNAREAPSLRPIAADIARKASGDETNLSDSRDPLIDWFLPQSAVAVRRIERAIQCLLIEGHAYTRLCSRGDYDGLSDLAAFYYTALFRTIRRILKRFVASNPTWLKRPGKRARLRPSLATLLGVFNEEADSMVRTFEVGRTERPDQTARVSISVASSEALPMEDKTVDLVLTSPPYCTRIDYAVATMVELALLGYVPNGNLDQMRRALIGTSTVPKEATAVSQDWGPTCRTFLQKVAAHRSKASRTYYYKNHTQYFAAIYSSLGEVSRVLRPLGRCIMVAQDSYYKDVHTDLPRILVEMAESHDLTLSGRKDFPLSTTLARVNPGTRQYRTHFEAMESVLCLTKGEDRSSLTNQLDHVSNVVQPIRQHILRTPKRPLA